MAKYALPPPDLDELPEAPGQAATRVRLREAAEAWSSGAPATAREPALLQQRFAQAVAGFRAVSALVEGDISGQRLPVGTTAAYGAAQAVVQRIQKQATPLTGAAF